MKPRPILKTRSSCGEYYPSPSTALPFKILHSPHVHFPPTPSLTDTQITHSPFVYDRAPITVSPNICRFPERGGRVYTVPGAEETYGGALDSYFQCAYGSSEMAPSCMDENLRVATFTEDASGLSSSPGEPDNSYSVTLDYLRNAELASLPPASQPSLGTRPRPKRKQTGRSRPAALDVKRSLAEMRMDIEVSLDGCLGGF